MKLNIYEVKYYDNLAMEQRFAIVIDYNEQAAISQLFPASEARSAVESVATIGIAVQGEGRRIVYF